MKRALAFTLFFLATPANAARVTDHADLTVDIDHSGASVCHFGESGPVDIRGCNDAEKLTLSNIKALEPNAFAAIVLHYPAYQTSITVTKAAPQHGAPDLAAYRQNMHARMAGTRMQLTDAPRLVQGQNGLPIIVSAIRNPELDLVTRTLEVRARGATYRILFSVTGPHAADVAALAEKTAKTVVARPAQ
jgi:hypothetical protein